MDQPHRFAPGVRVTVNPSLLAAGARGAYTIVRQLPPDNGDNQYRIKSESEAHERVARESQLTPV